MTSRQNQPAPAMSARLRTALIATCLLIAVLLGCLDHYVSRHYLSTGFQSKKTAVPYDFKKYNGKSFTVSRVVDGDTIDINIPDGKFSRTRIRLWGVDTPETKSNQSSAMYFGHEASEFTAKLTLEKTVRLYLDKTKTRGKYGRLLAYVLLPDGRFLNEALVTEGFAYADLRFSHKFYHKYKRLEQATRKSKKGLWEKVTRAQLPEWLKRKRPNLLSESEG